MQKNLAQEQLQRVMLLLVEVDHGVKVGIPLAHEGVQGNDGQNGLGQRKHNAPEGARLVAAVDGGAFQKLAGDAGFKEGACDDDVEAAQTAQQCNDERIVDQPQIAHHDECGNEAAAEIHGNDAQGIEYSAAHQLVIGKRIGCQHGKHYAERHEPK